MKDTANWPTWPILMWGSFGTQTPEGRRFHNTFKICVTVMLIGFMSGVFWHAMLGRALGAVLPGLAFTGIAVSFRRYLLTLDELARRIQVESIAWTYLTGLAVAPLLMGILLALGVHANFFGWLFAVSGMDSSFVDLISPYFYILLLEQIRTLWLYKVSRKY